MLFAFVTSQAGFDTRFAIANTASTAPGRSVRPECAPSTYFGRVGSTPVTTTQTTNQAIAPGDSFTFVLSAGGALGVNGLANFQLVP